MQLFKSSISGAGERARNRGVGDLCGLEVDLEKVILGFASSLTWIPIG